MNSTQRRPTRVLAASAALVAAAALGAGGGAAAYAALWADDGDTIVRQITAENGEATAAAVQSTDDLSVSEIYEQSYESVVEITVTTTSGETSPFGEAPQGQAQGTGFVYDDEGHVVTNQHVVGDAKTASVRLWNGETYDARVLGSDASTDLAVLDVDAPASVLEPLQLADSDDLAVGEEVVSIGSPFGLEGTVTSGIVSALHRQMAAPNNFTINDSIQTDAAINHGNSGGPLLNARGEVIGVTAQIQSESGGNDGVGFAIPSNTVESIVAQLLASGSVEHAYLGVSVAEIPASAASDLGTATGVEITEIRDDAPAAAAGLRAASGSETVDGQSYPTGGDVITAVDGEAVTTSAELQRAIDAKRPGDSVSITYTRDGQSETVEVTLGTRPS